LRWRRRQRPAIELVYVARHSLPLLLLLLLRRLLRHPRLLTRKRSTRRRIALERRRCREDLRIRQLGAAGRQWGRRRSGGLMHPCVPWLLRFLLLLLPLRYVRLRSVYANGTVGTELGRPRLLAIVVGPVARRLRHGRRRGVVGRRRRRVASAAAAARQQDGDEDRQGGDDNDAADDAADNGADGSGLFRRSIV
jgi:hypothetical protein